MKITCQSCQAKYTIADEKVAGKTVKIKCKKCGASIVVSGAEGAGAMAAPVATSAGGYAGSSAPTPHAPAPPGDDDEGEGATRVFAEGAASGGGAGGDEWTVNVTDEDQRTLGGPQIVVEYQRGVITADTYVWKDGMADWLPLSGVPELMRLVSLAAPRPAAGGPSVVVSAPYHAPAPAAAMPPGGLGGTMIMNEQAPSPLAGTPMAAIPPPAAAAAAPAAARRAAKGGSVDLFAPGQQQDVAPPGPTAAQLDRLVGERNENSVLFSISALTASVGAGKNDDPFDLGSLPAARNGRSGMDDIMNLGGGMQSGPMLAPPPLLAPVVEAPPPPPPVAPVAAMSPMGMGMGMHAGGMAQDYPQPKSKMPLILGLVAGVALLAGGGVFFVMRGGTTPSGGPGTTDSAAATATQAVAATPTQTAAPTQPTDAPKPADTGAQAAATPSTTAATTPAANTGRPAVGGALPGRGPDKPADTKPAEKPADEKPAKPADEKPAKPADEKPAKPDPGGSGGKEFDRAAAMSALSAAAGGARGCKKDDGPTGSGRVKVTFAPNGSVTSATVEGAPFAGTAVGGCVAASFRGAHVPAFDGSAVTVSKSFSIN